MAPFEVLYERLCRSALCWEEVGDKQLIRPEMVQQTSEKIQLIQQRLKVAQDRQKSYADNRRKDLTFQVGEHVFLKVSPTKGVIRFGKQEKLQRRFIGPFEILNQVGDVAYRLALPPSMVAIHPMFHVSMLQKYVYDPTHVISYEDLKLQPNLSFQERLVKILDRKEQVLRTKTIPLVKVLWKNFSQEEALWELEAEMKKKFSQLFGMYPNPNFQDEVLILGGEGLVPKVFRPLAHLFQTD